MLLPEFMPFADGLAANAVQALRAVDEQLGNLSRHSAEHHLASYQSWSNEAARRLGWVFDPVDVERIVLTPRHWVLQQWSWGSGPSDIHRLIDTERSDRKRVLERLLRSYVEIEAEWAAHTRPLFALDTNTYLQRALYFDQFGWGERMGEPVRLVIPLTVVREIDKGKLNTRKLRYLNTAGTWEDQAIRTRARKSSQKLRELFVDPDDIAVLPDGTEVQLLVDPLNHMRLPDADSEIIDRLVALKRLTGRQISVVTDDGGMEFLARVNGLNAVAYGARSSTNPISRRPMPRAADPLAQIVGD